MPEFETEQQKFLINFCGRCKHRNVDNWGCQLKGKVNRTSDSCSGFEKAEINIKPLESENELILPESEWEEEADLLKAIDFFNPDYGYHVQLAIGDGWVGLRDVCSDDNVTNEQIELPTAVWEELLLLYRVLKGDVNNGH